jgi:DNA-binding transcriptional regulator YhcF (GntR family)
MVKFSYKPDLESNVLKVQQLVDAILSSVHRRTLREGDPLPSVNDLIRESGLSRDTVFKAYAELKRRGVVEAIPNKGYFVARSQRRVFLFLDTFKAYKEVLYNSFKECLPDNMMIDINFHHYNIDVFKSIIRSSLGRFDAYIIMNFDHPEVSGIVSEIDPNKLLVIDWKIHSPASCSSVFQDFGDSVYNCLSSGWHLLRKYEEIVCIYPEYTYHPYLSVENVHRFCGENKLKFSIVHDLKLMSLRLGCVYFVFEDIDLAGVLEQANEKKFRLMEDYGILSYNDTPMKKFIAGGITVISTDFKLMGQKAAGFAVAGIYENYMIPTELIIRESL